MEFLIGLEKEFYIFNYNKIQQNISLNVVFLFILLFKNLICIKLDIYIAHSYQKKNTF